MSNALELILPFVLPITAVIYLGLFLGVELMMADLDIRMPHSLAFFLPLLSAILFFSIFTYKEDSVLDRFKLAKKYLLMPRKLLFNLVCWSETYSESKAKYHAKMKLKKRPTVRREWPRISEIFSAQYSAVCMGTSRY